MMDASAIARMAADLSALHDKDGHLNADSIEAYLVAQMHGLAPREKIAALKTLIDQFGGPCLPRSPHEVDEDVLTRICALLLGRKVSRNDLTSSELLEKLAESLNTIFNTLNQLISVINMTFTGEGSAEQTIRQVIGFRIAGEGPGGSLETYLGQISDAFLTAQQSFKDAAYTQVKQVLHALDPEKLAAETGKGLKFGPLKKAEMFEIYEERYGKIHKWFSSGRFMEDFLREFEKNCQTKFGNQGG